MESRSFLVIDPQSQVHIKTHPDNKVIDSESGYGLDVLRKAMQWSLQKPFQRSYQILAIKRLEKVSIEGQNALLKTVEEPSPSTTVILTTQNTEQILPTIRSRCEQCSVTELQTMREPTTYSWLEDIEVQQPSSTHTTLPNITKPEEVYEQAKHYAELDRSEVLEQLEYWIGELRQKPDRHYNNLDALLHAKEAITHNTHVEFTLEMLFLSMLPQKQYV